MPIPVSVSYEFAFLSFRSIFPEPERQPASRTGAYGPRSVLFAHYRAGPVHCKYTIYMIVARSLSRQNGGCTHPVFVALFLVSCCRFPMPHKKATPRHLPKRCSAYIILHDILIYPAAASAPAQSPMDRPSARAARTTSPSGGTVLSLPATSESGTGTILSFCTATI